MKFIITPSLERTVILKIVSGLWNQNDIKALITSCFFSRNNFERSRKWQEIEDKVLEKVSKFQLPGFLKGKLSGIVRPIGLEIFKWVEYHFKDNNYLLYIPSEFFFNMLGTIDKQKTTELLIKDETLSVERRYRLACIHCLEDYLPGLWDKLPENSKNKYYNKDRPEQVYDHLFMKFFTYSLKGELSRINITVETAFHCSQPFYAQLFRQAVRDGNIQGVKYFFEKLTPFDRQFFLPRAALEVANSFFSSNLVEVLCFLLSKMNQEEQIKIFKEQTVDALGSMLQYMLDWPFQDIFLETMSLVKGFIPQRFYEDLLQKIFHKVIDGFKDCCYQDIFIELCMQIPDEDRQSIVLKVCASASLLTNYFKIEHNQKMKLIFQDVTPEIKKEFIVSTNGISICCKLMNAGEWNLLELFIQDCITTKDELVKFEENFQEIVRCLLRCTDSWCKFVCLVDGLICKYGKRESEEEEIKSKSVKKFCSVNLKSNT